MPPALAALCALGFFLCCLLSRRNFFLCCALCCALCCLRYFLCFALCCLSSPLCSGHTHCDEQFTNNSRTECCSAQLKTRANSKPESDLFIALSCQEPNRGEEVLLPLPCIATSLPHIAHLRSPRLPCIATSLPCIAAPLQPATSRSQQSLISSCKQPPQQHTEAYHTATTAQLLY